MKSFLQAIFSLALLAALFLSMDWRQTITLFRQIDILPVILAIPLFPMGIWISAEKWRILLRAQQITIRSGKLFRVYWIGAFLSNFLPSNVGGDVSRLALTSYVGRPAEVAASIIMERLTGIAVLLSLTLLSLVYGRGYFQEHLLARLLWLMVLGGWGLLVSVVFFGERLADRVKYASFGKAGLFPRLLAKGVKVSQSLYLYRGHFVILKKCLMLSMLFYALTILAQYLFFVALDIPIGLGVVFLVAPLITLISLLPISLNGIGLAEGAHVLMFSLVGVPPEQAFAVALLARILQIAISSVGGIFLLTPKLDESVELNHHD